MTPRVLAPAPIPPAGVVTLGPDASHHLVRVLRVREGDQVQLFDGEGARFAATLIGADPKGCAVQVTHPETPLPESPIAITLAQCVSSAEKMDWTIEKAVELGVTAIVPLMSARGVVRLDDERGRRRLEHWNRLVVAACAQCGRDRLPRLTAPRSLRNWLASGEPTGRAYVLTPGASERVGSIAPGTDPVTLLVGPESGLSDDEVRDALAAGFSALSLGPRILRTETAGLAAIAALQARFGDL